MDGGASCLDRVALLLIFELAPFYFVVVTAFKQEQQISQIQSIFWPEPWTRYSSSTCSARRATRGLVEKHHDRVHRDAADLRAGSLSQRLRSDPAALEGRPYHVKRRLARLSYARHPDDRAHLPDLFFLSLTNSLASLFFSYPTFALPFAIWLMMGYYATIPEELEAAALVTAVTASRPSGEWCSR